MRWFCLKLLNLGVFFYAALHNILMWLLEFFNYLCNLFLLNRASADLIKNHLLSIWLWAGYSASYYLDVSSVKNELVYIYTHILRIPSDTASSHLHEWEGWLSAWRSKGYAISKLWFCIPCTLPVSWNKILHSNTIHRLGYKNSRRKISSI